MLRQKSGQGKKQPDFKPIKGDHAIITLEKKGPLRGRVKRTEFILLDPYSPAYSPAMTLAHLLYPKHFPKQIASDRRVPSIRYSGLVRLDSKSRQAISARYNYGYERELSAREVIPSYGRHAERVSKKVGEIYSEPEKKTIVNRMYEAGITVNIVPVNVGFTAKGTPVFFEVATVRVDRLRQAVNKIRNPLKKKQALAVLSLLEEIIPKGKHSGLVSVHSGPI